MQPPNEQVRKLYVVSTLTLDFVESLVAESVRSENRMWSESASPSNLPTNNAKLMEKDRHRTKCGSKTQTKQEKHSG